MISFALWLIRSRLKAVFLEERLALSVVRFGFPSWQALLAAQPLPTLLNCRPFLLFQFSIAWLFCQKGTHLICQLHLRI